MLNTPTIREGAPIDVPPLGGGFYRVIARFGFMESPDVPIAPASHDLHRPVAQRAARDEFLQYSGRLRRGNRYSARNLGARMAQPLGGV
jgi:KUP system potassium uptake protein